LFLQPSRHEFRRAIRAFQRDCRLMADGVPGPQMQAALVGICGY
jgi:hypothetical protein